MSNVHAVTRIHPLKISELITCGCSLHDQSINGFVSYNHQTRRWETDAIGAAYYAAFGGVPNGLFNLNEARFRLAKYTGYSIEAISDIFTRICLLENQGWTREGIADLLNTMGY